MQVDMVLGKFKERGILRDEVKEQDGRTLRFLYFIREHPLVQNVLGKRLVRCDVFSAAFRAMMVSSVE